MNHIEHANLVEIATGKPFECRPRLLKFLETVKVEENIDMQYVNGKWIPLEQGNYTSSQRNSAWLYMTMKVQQLNEAGLEMRKVLKPTYAIPWTKESFHDHVWVKLQKAMYGTDSMRALKKLQVSRIHEVIERELGEKHGLEYIPFPADSERTKESLGGYKTSAGESVIPYPDEYKEPLV